MAEINDRHLKYIFSQVIEGFSRFNYTSKSFFSSKSVPIYIKHFTLIDYSFIDNQYNYFYEKAISEKIPTIKEKTEYLVKEKLWDAKNDVKIKDYQGLIHNLEDNLIRQYLKSKRDELKRNIQEIQMDIDKLNYEKNSLLGMTAEFYANKNSSILYIKNSFYKGPDLQERYFNEEEFDDVGEREMQDYISIYNTYTNDFRPDILKKISILPVFLNIFSLSENNLQSLFGKAVISLTMHQIDIISYCRYFKNILSEYGNKIPKAISADPNQLIDWIECKRLFEEQMGDKEGNIGIPGTKEDLEFLGIQNQTIDYSKEMKRLGVTKLTRDHMEKLG